MRQKFLVAAVVMALLSACSENKDDSDIIWDTPYVEFYEEKMTIYADGGDMIVPVRSSGVDNVTFVLSSGDRWDIKNNSGMNSDESWVKFEEIIDNYEVPTRALPCYHSGISLHIEPNTTGSERSVSITVNSSQASDTIVIMQSADNQ